MSGIGRLRRAMLVGAAVVAAAGCVTLTAGPAQAATTISCSVGLTVLNSTSVGGTGCAGFVDSGAPYVFQLGTLSVNNFPFSPPLPKFSSYSNAVATCSSAEAAGPAGVIDGSGCTFRL